MGRAQGQRNGTCCNHRQKVGDKVLDQKLFTLSRINNLLLIISNVIRSSSHHACNLLVEHLLVDVASFGDSYGKLSEERKSYNLQNAMGLLLYNVSNKSFFTANELSLKATLFCLKHTYIIKTQHQILDTRSHASISSHHHHLFFLCCVQVVCMRMRRYSCSFSAPYTYRLFYCSGKLPARSTLALNFNPGLPHQADKDLRQHSLLQERRSAFHSAQHNKTY